LATLAAIPRLGDWRRWGKGEDEKALPTGAVRCIVVEFRILKWKLWFTLKEEYP
jgi:hypothetical protein